MRFLLLVFIIFDVLADDCAQKKSSIDENCKRPNETVVSSIGDYVKTCKASDHANYLKMIENAEKSKSKIHLCADKFKADPTLLENLKKGKLKEDKSLEKYNSEKSLFNNSESPYQKDFVRTEGSVSFFASKHTRPMMEASSAVKYSENVLSSLKNQSKDILIVEQSEEFLSNKAWLSCLYVKTKDEVINGKFESERELAIWDATHNGIAISGGEPTENDFNEYFSQGIDGVTKDDHDKFNIFICVRNFHESGKAKPEEKKSVDLAISDCAKNKNLSNLKPSEFKEWFNKKAVNPYDFRGTAETKASLDDLYSSNQVIFTPWPNANAPKGSLAQIENLRNQLKNYCLRNSIDSAFQNNLKKVSVIYGGDHLFENYEALTPNENIQNCELGIDTKNCPNPDKILVAPALIPTPTIKIESGTSVKND